MWLATESKRWNAIKRRIERDGGRTGNVLYWQIVWVGECVCLWVYMLVCVWLCAFRRGKMDIYLIITFNIRSCHITFLIPPFHRLLSLFADKMMTDRQRERESDRQWDIRTYVLPSCAVSCKEENDENDVGSGSGAEWNGGGDCLFFTVEFMIAHTHTDTHTHCLNYYNTQTHSNTTPSHERACDQNEGVKKRWRGGRREGGY